MRRQPSARRPSAKTAERAEEAEEHEVGLDLQAPFGGDDRRVGGEQPARQQHRDEAAVAHQQAGEDDVGAGDEHRQHAHHPEGVAGPDRPPDEGEREQQQRDARRLNGDEVPVGDDAVGEADGGAEVGAVVVGGAVEEEGRPRQLAEADGEGEEGEDGDRRDDEALAVARDLLAGDGVWLGGLDLCRRAGCHREDLRTRGQASHGIRRLPPASAKRSQPVGSLVK